MGRRYQSYQDRNRHQETGRQRHERSLVDRIKQDVKSWFSDEEYPYDDGVEHNYRVAAEDRDYNEFRQYSDMRNRYGQSTYDRERPSGYRYDVGEAGNAGGGRAQNQGYGRTHQSFHEAYPDEQAYRSQRREYGHGHQDYQGQRNQPYDYAWSEDWDVPGPYAGKGPKGFQRSPESLQERICERLEAHGGINAENFEVKVDNSEVTLEGQVGNRFMKCEAERCAESIRGIKDVHNRLTIDRDLDISAGSQEYHKPASATNTQQEAATGRASTSASGAGKRLDS